jgi:hypothetical protein
MIGTSLGRSICMVMLLTACSGDDSGEGCTIDNDCKGDRVCDQGQCVAPSNAPTDGGTTQPSDGSSGTSGASGAAGAGGSSGGSTSTATCEECTQAALDMGGTCEPEVDACGNNPTCAGLAICVSQTCGGAADLAACLTAQCPNVVTQAAVDGLAAIDDCLCERGCSSECASECAGGSGGAGGAGGVTGGSAGTSACTLSLCDCDSFRYSCATNQSTSNLRYDNLGRVSGVTVTYDNGHSVMCNFTFNNLGECGGGSCSDDTGDSCPIF